MCDRASYMTMARNTNLMQQFFFSIIINISTCFGHLYVHLQEYRSLYYCIWCSALGVVTEVLRSRCVVLCTVCKVFMVIKRNCCIKLVLLDILINRKLTSNTDFDPEDGISMFLRNFDKHTFPNDTKTEKKTSST